MRLWLRLIGASILVWAGVVWADVVWEGVAHADSAGAVSMVRGLPGVVNASEDGGGNLWVAVQNQNGALWNAYATSICTLIRPQHARIFLVKIVDFTTVRPKTKPRDWLMLGAANCAMAPSAPAPQ